MFRSSSQPMSGPLLVADFQRAFIALATSEAAQYEAERSENQLISQLKVMSHGGFLNPGKIDTATQTDITRGSLDAHIKKLQAQQLTTFSGQELQRLSQQDQALYQGRRIRASVLQRRYDVIESVWFDKQHGYRNAATKRLAVTGIIHDVLLDMNMLVVRTNWRARLLTPDRHFFVVYIINPDTLEPLVDLTLL